jgi:agmatinase
VSPVLKGFDPNAAASGDEGIFGLPFTENDAALVYLPVPWEVTTSYGGGTSNGPKAIAKASLQVDLFDADVLKPYEAGLCMLEEDPAIRALGDKARGDAQKILAVGGDLGSDMALRAALERVNAAGSELNEAVYLAVRKRLEAGKIVGLVGGDHSTPFGSIRAHAEKYPGMGLLHFDAHSDTRDAYEGFVWSHASIMRNVLEGVPGLGKTVQVGIRDFCEEEAEYLEKNRERVSVFYDRDLKTAEYRGQRWDGLCETIVSELPEAVYVTFDIDGLDPRYCPNTGTPVPGGLDFSQAGYLLGAVVRSGRKIVGFDLNEVAPDPAGGEWDANVGARLLYKLSAWTLASLGKAELRP